jgi:small ligand-binding sensory domain FIST
VTRAEGPIIEEIDGRPALDVISSLTGGGRDPSEFAFHVMLGVNQGDRWAPYEEDNYSNCLCLRADIKRKQIIMFEPELVTGTRFQLMSRSHDPEAIDRKVDALFQEIGDRTPFFALYINCAGRAGAYAGVKEEDGHYVQSSINGRAPLLGFYSGVEIGPIRGDVKSMDWTGVLCLFTAKA